MTGFDATVGAELRRRGRVPFAEFMGWALSHPRGGYYAAGPLRTGRSGDFVTNVNVPLYAEILAAQFLEMWEVLGSERFVLMELGGGDGTLMERVLRVFEARGRHKKVSAHLIEQSVAARAAAHRRLSRFPHVALHASLDDLEHTAGVEGCVYSNEFFDALPVHRVRWTNGSLMELYVEEQDGARRETPGPLSDPRLQTVFDESGVAPEEGQEGEICLALEHVVSELGRLLARGFVLTVDYGGAPRDLWSPARPTGTVRSFEKHRLVDSPLVNVGGRDITAHVDFAHLARCGSAQGWATRVYADQGPFLLAAGETVLRQAIENSTEHHRRAREVRQLVHPAAFGAHFRVLIQSQNAQGLTLKADAVSRGARLS